MTNTSKTILFFGTDTFSATSLRALIAAGFVIGAVITKPDSQKGRGRKVIQSAVKTIALEYNIPVWQPTKVVETLPDIAKLTAKNGHAPTGVLVSYGKIIPQSVIDAFEIGIINVHPSLLPIYRGPSPIESAILNGDNQTGVTIMQLNAAMDAGPIYTQAITPLTGNETAPQLEEQLGEQGAQMLCEALPAILNNSLTPTPQNDSQATYCQLLRKEDNLLRPNELAATQAERKVRAHLAFPKTKYEIAGHNIVITEAQVVTAQDTNVAKNETSPLSVRCSDGNYLQINALIGPSGKAMTAAAFTNGYLK